MTPADYFHFTVDPDELIEIELENGATIMVTKNHKMYRPDGTVVLAGDLADGDDLMGLDDEPRTDRRTRVPDAQPAVH